MRPDSRPMDEEWLTDERYQTVLRAVNTIAFEYDADTGEEAVAPFIQEYIKGNFDGRLISDAMLEEGVVHPEDREALRRFAEGVRRARGGGEITVRLRTPEEEFHWFRIFCCPTPSRPEQGRFVGCVTDVDGEVRQRLRLQYQAEHDEVSGLYHRTAFFRRARDLMEADPERVCHLVRFDVDRFSMINSIHSQTAGDQVLGGIGAILRELTRPEEVCARMGDDVFCVCLARGRAETLALLEELERRVAEIPVDFRLSISAGIVPVRPGGDGRPVSLLCDLAALAQRTVKGSSVHRCAFYDEKMRLEFNREHEITTHMHQALEERQFQMYLQPKFDISTNTLIGAEALVRWLRPEEGMVRPDAFIPLFERNGFILQLDAFVWEEACRKLREWQDRGLTPVPISVNVSRVHIYDPDFCVQVQALTTRYGIAPSLLELEVTESAYTENPQELYAVMERLQRQGFRFDMDDFGSGYSSLNVLKDIPVDLVKIDLNFLRKPRRGEKVGKTILKSTIDMIRALGLPILAEGVETREQVEFLLDAGCTRAQGYLFGAPMPPGDFEALAFEKELSQL